MAKKNGGTWSRILATKKDRERKRMNNPEIYSSRTFFFLVGDEPH
jgi:hypothetical protein